MKKITILGSTGSIGTQTLEIAETYHDRLEVIGLAAGNNVTLMEEQVRKFKPKYVAMWTEEKAKDLRERLGDMNVDISYGMEGLIKLCTLSEIDTVVTAIVGMIGIRPTIEAIKAKKDIALANKETLVTAGHIIMPLCKEFGVSILPVDSEHSAIFQSMQGQPKERIKTIHLTASGGPFRGKKREELLHIQVEDALKHPNWDMGQKITIDSATMVNKGLEVMEAGWLFDVKAEQIKVVVHPQSIIHSMVEYVDKGIIAQLGMPDMKLPIQYALFYPDRLPMEEKGINFYELGKITFEEPDLNTFMGLKLAYDAFGLGGSVPTVFNAANEKAVSLFLNRKIKFLEIPEIIGLAMEQHKPIINPTVEQILETEMQCYDYIESRW